MSATMTVPVSVRSDCQSSRPLVLSFALIKQATVVKRLGMMRIDGDRLVELGQRLIGFSGLRQRLGARGMAMRIACAGRRRRRHLRGGFLLGR